MQLLEAARQRAQIRPATGPGRDARAHIRPPYPIPRAPHQEKPNRERQPHAPSFAEVVSYVNDVRIGLGPRVKENLNKADLAVEAGHTDGPALDANNTEEVDLRQSQPDLNRVIDVQTGPAEAQPIQWTVPDAMAKTKSFVVAAFTGRPNRAIEDFDPPTNFAETVASRDGIMEGYIDSQNNLHRVATRRTMRRVLRREESRGLLKGLEGLYVEWSNYKEALKDLKKRGFVVIGPSWNHDTSATQTGKPGVRNAERAAPDRGLTDLGEEIIKEMDAMGIVADLSHASLQTQYDVLSIPSRLPRVFTHAGSRAITDHPRNVDDDVARLIINGGRFIRTADGIKLLAKGEKAPDGVAVHKVKRGGMIGMPMVATFVKKDPSDATEITTVENVVDHLEHFKDIGLLHGIALGTEFAGMGKSDVVEGVENVQVYKDALRETMEQRGFTEKEIRMVLRENALRFWLKNLPKENSLKRLKNSATVFASQFTLPEAA